MSLNHSLEYITARMKVLKEEQERQSREIDDLQGRLDSLKKGGVVDGERLNGLAGLPPRRSASVHLVPRLELCQDLLLKVVEQDRNKREIDDLQGRLDSLKKGDVELEEWDNEFMWSPSTMILYDYDGNKVGVVKDVNDAIIEFYDF